MEPFPGLIVFDAVEGLNSTLGASELLNLPQSSVSRRYRQFADSLRITLSRQFGTYRVVRGQCTLKQVRQLAQRFRFLHQLNRWAMHPALEPWLKQHAGQLPGQQLRLPPEHWEGWLNQRLIDQILDCRILNGEIPHQTEIHLALVLDPAPASQNSVFLGDWSSVDGLEDAVRAAGWMIAANQPTSETAGTLKALPAQQAFSASKPTHLVVAEVALHWRYGPLIQQLDPLAETERQQFERLLLTCLCLGTGTASQNNLDVPGLDFSGLPLG